MAAQTPLIFVHGFPLAARMWNAQRNGWGSRPILIPDLRGFGGPPADELATSMEQFADDLAALQDEQLGGEPAIFVGLSMGGYILLALHRRAPHRACGYVFCDTKAEADTAEAAAAREQSAQRVLTEGSGVLRESLLPKLISAETARDQPAVVQSLTEMITAAPAAGVAAAQRGMARRTEANSILGTMDVPVLVVCGESDAITPPAGMRAMAAAIPRAEFALIPGAGHMSPMEQPTEFNRHLHRYVQTHFS